MKFIDPSFKELYDKLHDNKKLEKFFISQKILVGMDEYYENYGYNIKNKETAYAIIKETNERVYSNLAELLLPCLNTIKKEAIRELVSKQFLKEEIKLACGFSQDVNIADDVLWEIFYCVKYCYTTSFFQNNWENFIPKYDFENMEENPALEGFMDSIMKEFDKLEHILDSFKDFKDYKKIPYDYIVYLTQLLGVEPRDFMIMTDQKEQYRCLAENIIDVYSVRGTASSFELLFNFLGYTLEIEEYFFDRRLYYSLEESNEELGTNNNMSYKYYMTTKDPRYNLLEELGTNEVVGENDISEKYDLRNFDKLVEEYGLRCVLGYDDEYIVENRSDDGDVIYSSDVRKYTGPVYKYFRTNYVRIKPCLKYSSGNFSLDQLYQISALLNFLTPEFLTRETYVVINIGQSEDRFVLNWNRDEELDDFFILDSENWEQNFADKYITNYYDGEGTTGYLNSGYMIIPFRRRDNGSEDVYVNSLGLSEHYSGGKQNNVFFNPISEKIKIINSTKYWGDKVKIDSYSKALYPVYRIMENYELPDKKKFYAPEVLDGRRQITELYIPKDSRFIMEREMERWNTLEKVSLNGFNGTSLKNKQRDKSYGKGGYYNFNRTNERTTNRGEKATFVVSRQEVDLVIDGTLVDFMRLNSYEGLSEKDRERKDHFFEKKWLKTDNYVWKYKFSFDVSNTEFLKGFVAKHRNVINYDYMTGKLFCSPEFYNMSFSENSDRLVVKNAYSSSPADMNLLGTELVNNMTDPFSYIITLDVTKKSYAVYQQILLNKFDALWFNKFRPVPILISYIDNASYGKNSVVMFDTTQVPNYTFSTYSQLLDCVVDDVFVYSENFQRKINSSNDLVIFVINDGICYKFVRLPTVTRKVLHKNVNATVNTINLLDINVEETLEKKLIGSFYMSDFKSYEDLSAEEIAEGVPEEERVGKIVDARTPKIFQYRYANIRKNMTIYSKSDQKLYRVNLTSAFRTDDTIRVNGNIINKEEQTVEQKGGTFGVEELNFYGRMVFEERDGEDRAYIYEYDDQYPGFSEKDDDDNFIFNNFEREYVWKNMKVATESVKTFVDEAGTIQMVSEEYTRLTSKRPIKVNIDKIFEERDSKEFYQKKDESGKPIDDGALLNKNVLSSSILREICDSYGSDYRQRDRVVLLN